jgi:Fur family ferric uptake transcriptional regulator
MKLSLNKKCDRQSASNHGRPYMPDVVDSFRAHLRSHRLRLTRERLEILSAVLASDKHFDAEDLFARLGRRRPPVSRATIYRTLTLLEQCGVLRRSLLGGDRRLYERAIERGHHDHIVCASCGRIVEFFDSRLEALQERIALRRGFRINRHVHELFGTCKECRAARRRALAENGRRRSRTLA